MASPRTVPVHLRVGDGGQEHLVAEIDMDGVGDTVTVRWRSRLAQCLREVADEIESTQEE